MLIMYLCMIDKNNEQQQQNEVENIIDSKLSKYFILTCLWSNFIFSPFLKTQVL